jgi:hypothetical protein
MSLVGVVVAAALAGIVAMVVAGLMGDMFKATRTAAVHADLEQTMMTTRLALSADETCRHSFLTHPKTGAALTRNFPATTTEKIALKNLRIPSGGGAGTAMLTLSDDGEAGLQVSRLELFRATDPKTKADISEISRDNVRLGDLRITFKKPSGTMASPEITRTIPIRFRGAMIGGNFRIDDCASLGGGGGDGDGDSGKLDGEIVSTGPPCQLSGRDTTSCDYGFADHGDFRFVYFNLEGVSQSKDGDARGDYQMLDGDGRVLFEGHLFSAGGVSGDQSNRLKQSMFVPRPGKARSLKVKMLNDGRDTFGKVDVKFMR